MGADFFFADLPTPAKRLVISFVRTNNGGGFAFDNFNGTEAFVNVNAPLDPDDDDGDGTSDGNDNCPLDANPDQDDTDSDGVGDVCDICANTPPNSVVVTDPYSPIYGCVDNDGDGVLNGVDQCPSTPANDPVNTDGCTDNDGDGVEDTADHAHRPRQATRSITRGAPIRMVMASGMVLTIALCQQRSRPCGCDSGDVCAPMTTVMAWDGADQCPSTRSGQSVNSGGCTDTDR